MAIELTFYGKSIWIETMSSIHIYKIKYHYIHKYYKKIFRVLY